ncbi:MAG: hypothetical protein NG712_05095 [Omnitrophica bacterium]|nr:hypothetical protein [Candidatus Omnitrophota bacterium]
MSRGFKSVTLAILSIILSGVISGCGTKDSVGQLLRLNSVVQVNRINRQTSAEEPIFVFKAADFKYAFVVEHMLLNPFEFVPKPFEVRAILGEKKKITYKNFIRDNLGTRIKVLLNRKLMLSMILTRPIEYISLGYYDSKAEAYAVARKIVHSPLYEDLRQKETREKDILEKELLEEKSYEIKAAD